jgi:hypothetical protein
MDTLVLKVTPSGSGFVAVDRRPALSAVDPLPAEPVEDGRLVARYGEGPRPTTVIARIHQPGASKTLSTGCMPTVGAFGNAEMSGWRYVASLPCAAQKVAQ